MNLIRISVIRESRPLPAVIRNGTPRHLSLSTPRRAATKVGVRESLGTVQVHIEGRQAPITFEITDNDPWLVFARPELGLEYHFNLDAYDSLLRPGASKQLPPELQQGGDQVQTVSPDEFVNVINR